MNRSARFALLTPLLVSAVAMPPTMAAHATPAAPATAPQAACALKVTPGTSDFELELTGFKPGQQVNVEGPEKFTRTIQANGSFTEPDVTKGSYTAKFGKNKKNRQAIGCTKAPKITPVRITDAEITSPEASPAEVDCSITQSVTFVGRLTGTGTGDVDYKWVSGGRSSTPSLKFTAPSTPTAGFPVKVPGRAAPPAGAASPPVHVTATLTAGGSQDTQEFTLKCRAGT
ncbi:hypothetical protein ACFWB1_15975 [Streptomyces goshikiensis]|uniref:hypothetical protein n=1 Tax=Streptomyces goshikiensis TaxID=1942 RepID=UPI003699E1EC